MNKTSQQVAPNLRGGWMVKRYRAKRASRVFNTQEEAIRFARKRAKEEYSDLYIHRRDGSVQKKECYDIHPNPTNGRK